MKIARSNIVIAKLIVALICETTVFIIAKSTDWVKYIPAAIVLLVNICTLIIIHIKKKEYNNVFLQLTYIPSDILFIIGFIFEIPTICLYTILFENYYVLTIHLLISIALYLPIYQGRRSFKHKIKNNMKMQFEYGVLAEDIPHSPLSKGAFVKIQRKNGETYIVKDYDNNEYEIDKHLIENIHKVNLE